MLFRSYAYSPSVEGKGEERRNSEIERQTVEESKERTAARVYSEEYVGDVNGVIARERSGRDPKRTGRMWTRYNIITVLMCNGLSVVMIYTVGNGD